MFILDISGAPAPGGAAIAADVMLFTAIAFASHFMFDQSAASVTAPAAAASVATVAAINPSNATAPAPAAAATPTFDPDATAAARAAPRAPAISLILPAVIAFPYLSATLTAVLNSASVPVANPVITPAISRASGSTKANAAALAAATPAGAPASTPNDAFLNAVNCPPNPVPRFPAKDNLLAGAGCTFPNKASIIYYILYIYKNIFP